MKRNLSHSLFALGNHKYQEKICEFKWLYIHSNKYHKFFNSNKKRLPSYSTLTKETKNSKVYEEKKEAQAQASSHTRFGLRSHSKKYKEFCETQKTPKSQEVFENSFMLFQNIKNHLKQDSAKAIYTSEPGQIMEIPETTEHVQLNRMVWPEHMDNTLKTKIQTGVPLTGRSLNKEKGKIPR